MKIHQIRFQDIPFHRDLRCGLGLINYRHVVQHPITKRFPLTNLGKVLTLQYGEALSDVERAGGGYPVVGSNGVVGFHDEYVVEGPCIVLGRKGSAGEVTFVESNCFPIDTTFYVVRKTDSFNIKFLAYLLRVLRLQRLALLKGVPGLNRFDAYDVPIPLVPEDIQTKILRRIQPIEKDIALLRERIVGFTSIVNVEFAKAFNIDTTTIKNLASIKVLPTTLSVFSQNPSLRFSFHHQKYSNLTNLFGDSDFWQPLPKVFSVSGGKRVPKGVGFSPEDTRFRYLRPNEVSFNEVNREEMPFLYERTYIRLKRYKINDGDFAISIVGTLGKTALPSVSIIVGHFPMHSLL